MDLIPIDLETLDFKLVFNTEFETTKPKVNISINDEELYSGELEHGTQEIEFTKKLKVNQTHCIKIVRSGKQIGENQITRIVDLIIDKISIRDIMWDDCKYYPIYPEPWATEQKIAGNQLEYPVIGETWFGHNGEWQFQFDSLFYIWLINKVRGRR